MIDPAALCRRDCLAVLAIAPVSELAIRAVLAGCVVVTVSGCMLLETRSAAKTLGLANTSDSVMREENLHEQCLITEAMQRELRRLSRGCYQICRSEKTEPGPPSHVCRLLLDVPRAVLRLIWAFASERLSLLSRAHCSAQQSAKRDREATAPLGLAVVTSWRSAAQETGAPTPVTRKKARQGQQPPPCLHCAEP